MPQTSIYLHTPIPLVTSPPPPSSALIPGVICKSGRHYLALLHLQPRRQGFSSPSAQLPGVGGGDKERRRGCLLPLIPPPPLLEEGWRVHTGVRREDDTHAPIKGFQKVNALPETVAKAVMDRAWVSLVIVPPRYCLKLLHFVEDIRRDDFRLITPRCSSLRC